MTAPPSPAIELEGFGFRYAGQEVWALRDVDLRIDRGCVVALTGSSGAGKSTLSLALNGTVPQSLEGATEGRVTVCGLDASLHPVSRLAGHVGMVFQDPEVQLFTLTVEDEVALSLECAGVPRAEMRRRVDWALATCGLERLALAAPARLSGGLKQRVAIASVLARDPDVLVFDDPTANLDPDATRGVYATIRRVAEQRTVVVIARDLGPLYGLLDRVVVLDGGRVVADGEPRALLEQAELLARCGIRPPPVTALAHGLRRASGGHWRWPGRVPVDEAELLAALPARRGPQPAAVERAAAPARGGEPAVEFDGVTFAYERGRAALADVDLTILPGELVALTGRNGAGKTTLLHHVIGLLRPTAGTVRVAGRDTAGATVAQLARQVGLIFQNPNHQLFRDTVASEVAFGPASLGWEPERVEAAVARALAVTGTEALREQDPELLSMGHKQRVAVASVLALGPRVLLLDEPTTGQDETGIAALMALVGRLNAEGVTVLMISHDMDVVLAHAGRMLVLADGRLIADGPPAELLRRPDVLARGGLEAPPVIGLARRLLGGDARTVDELAVAVARSGLPADAVA